MNWEEAKAILGEAIRAPRSGLITDVDGTISPIVEEPEAARVTPRNLECLARLAELMPLVAVLSGRAAQDAARRVGLPALVYIGNHGMDEWAGGSARTLPSVAAYRGALSAARREIQEVLAGGMLLEDKGATLSVHFRRARQPESAAAELRPALQAIAEQHGLRLTRGRMVFELRPPVEVDKSSAFEGLVRAHRLEAAFYLGDDTTDLAVFRAAARLRRSGSCLAYGLGVRSPGAPPAVLSEADFLIEEVAGVESFLEWLLKARMASST